MGWHLVEWLDRDADPTLVWKDATPREWRSLSLISRREGIDRGALNRLVDTALKLPAGSFADRERAALISSQVPGQKGPRTVELHHVVGPGDTVLGLQMWVAPVDEPIASRPRAAGLRYRPSKRVFESGEDAWMLTASNLERYGRGRPADTLFNRAVVVPNLGEIMDLCVSAHPTVTDLRTDVKLLHQELRLVNMSLVARRRGECAWAIGMDTTRWVRSPVLPEIAMRMSGISPDTCRGVITFQNDPDYLPSIMFWVDEPPEWTAYWSDGAPYPDPSGTLVNKDDRRALLAVRAQIEAGAASVAVTLRIRHRDGSWVPVQSAVSRYPSDNPDVFVVEFAHS